MFFFKLEYFRRFPGKWKKHYTNIQKNYKSNVKSYSQKKYKLHPYFLYAYFQKNYRSHVILFVKKTTNYTQIFFLFLSGSKKLQITRNSNIRIQIFAFKYSDSNIVQRGLLLKILDIIQMQDALWARFRSSPRVNKNNVVPLHFFFKCMIC